MDFQASFLEQAWDDLLSRDAKRVIDRFLLLDIESQKTVLDHLNKMASEEGWHPEQVISANAALKALNERTR